MNDLSVNFISSDDVACARYSRDYERNQKTIQDFLKEYKPEESHGELLLSSSTLRTSVTVDGTKIEDYFNDNVRILKYCIARIDEIEDINHFSHTPSAYSCILSFLAFLGQASHNSDRNDGLNFEDYCKKHVKRLRCVRMGRSVAGLVPRDSHHARASHNTWGEVMYTLIRCGLIHAMSSIGNRDPLQNEVEVRLTHCSLNNASVFEFLDTDGSPTSVVDSSSSGVVLTINAFDLCSAIRDSILHIYTEGSDVQNMQNYFMSHPPLMAVVDGV